MFEDTAVASGVGQEVRARLREATPSEVPRGTKNN